MKAKFTITNPKLLGMSASAAVYKVGMEIVRDTKQRCPVDTGNLRRSYNFQRDRGNNRAVSGYVGTNVHYAPYVEFGTKNMQAQPHLGPAYSAAKAKYS